jgi:hypothetical protein
MPNAINNNTTLTTATLDSVTVSPSGGGGCGGGGLPTGWAEQDVGSVGLAGSAQFSNATFTVKVSGADI